MKMKKRIQKWMALLLAVFLVTSLFPGTTITATAAKAKTPKLSMSSKTLNGIGSTFTLSIKNLDKSKVKSTTWYTTNKKVVTVNAKTGYVTAVGKGTAYIKNKIVYKDGTVLRPACKVMVKIPATAIKITNTPPEGTDYFTLTVGESIDFNAVLTPSNSTDLITYTVDNTTCAKVNKKGIVTALKAGPVILTATASKTKAAAATSKVQDRVKINIVPKTAGVKSAVLTNSTTLTITFDEAMNGTTMLDSNGKLLDSITIQALANSDGTAAGDLGTLTGTLSSDGKTLTITSEKAFNGNYILHLSSSILTANGTALTEYYKDLKLVDKTPPTFKSYKVDDTGLIVTIEFSEPMDFTNMAVSKVSLVKAGETANTSTISLLKTKTNYVASEDNKSLVIDLSSIPSSDYNKTFSVVFSGLKDKAGNYPANSVITAYVATDTTEKPQARLISLTRTGYYTLTATFSRSIKTPGIVILSNGKTIDGVVSKTDKKKVNFTLDAASAKLTGSQKVSIGYWDSYNVKATDTTADKLTERMVNFTVSTTGPQLKSYKLTTETTKNNTTNYILTLTYDKEVVLQNDSGKFTSKLVAANGDISSQKMLEYTATAKDTVVTVKLNEKQFDTNGIYTITIPEGFVKDNFNNDNKKTQITINRTDTNGTGLPAPEKIEQSSEDYNIVYVTFGNKLDKTSAETVSNYSILGVSIAKAELIENSVSGAVVQLTLNSGSVSVSAVYAVVIKGIKGYGDSYSAMEPYETTVYLNENKMPVISKITQTGATTIAITFDEEITGTPDFSVMQYGTELADSSAIAGNTVYIFLTQQPTKGVTVTITPTRSNSITDLSGNKVTVTTRYFTPTY
jgi:hypothetical protein